MPRVRIIAAGAAFAAAIGGAVFTIGRLGHQPEHAVRAVAEESRPGLLTARVVAMDVLDRAVVPPNAAHYAGTPPAVVSTLFETRTSSHLVDRHRLWTVDKAFDDAYAFVQTHTPRGMQREGGGTLSRYGVVTERDIRFYAPNRDTDIGSVELTFALAPRSPDSTWIRADAQVTWRSRRDAAEHTIDAERVVTITRTPTFSPDTSHAPPRIVVTDAATVDHLKRLFNALKVAIPAAHSCLPAPRYTLAFGTTPSAPPDMIATMDCQEVAVTARGKRLHTLEQGYLRLAVDALFQR